MHIFHIDFQSSPDRFSSYGVERLVNHYLLATSRPYVIFHFSVIVFWDQLYCLLLTKINRKKTDKHEVFWIILPSWTNKLFFLLYVIKITIIFEAMLSGCFAVRQKLGNEYECAGYVLIHCENMMKNWKECFSRLLW